MGDDNDNKNLGGGDSGDGSDPGGDGMDGRDNGERMGNWGPSMDGRDNGERMGYQGSSSDFSGPWVDGEETRPTVFGENPFQQHGMWALRNTTPQLNFNASQALDPYGDKLKDALGVPYNAIKTPVGLGTPSYKGSQEDSATTQEKVYVHHQDDWLNPDYDRLPPAPPTYTDIYRPSTVEERRDEAAVYSAVLGLDAFFSAALPSPLNYVVGGPLAYTAGLIGTQGGEVWGSPTRFTADPQRSLDSLGSTKID
jgi:hypothetical protein